MSSAMVFLRDAFRLYQTGQTQHAAQLCQQALEIDPRQSDAWHLLAALAYQQGQFPAAISAVARICSSIEPAFQALLLARMNCRSSGDSQGRPPAFGTRAFAFLQLP